MKFRVSDIKAHYRAQQEMYTKHFCCKLIPISEESRIELTKEKKKRSAAHKLEVVFYLLLQNYSGNVFSRYLWGLGS